MDHGPYSPTLLRRRFLRPFLAAASAGLVLLLAACGGGAAGDVEGGALPPPAIRGLHAAAFTGLAYTYGEGGQAWLPVANAPADADFSRWAMLHDGSTSFLFCFRYGSDATLYLFGLNDAAGVFELGYEGPPTIGITGTPASADPGSIAMLHDGSEYRLYMRGRGDPRQLYQFALNSGIGEFQYGYRSVPVIDTTGVPDDADLQRWGMLCDGSTYRQYVARAGTTDTIYQFGFNPATADYQLGYDSIPVLRIDGMPPNGILTSFALLHDLTRYRLYHLAR